VTSSRLPRDLHPVAWWVWALGLATAASFTTNPLVLLTIDGVAVLVVMARRPEQPWAEAFKVYVMVAVVIVLIRGLINMMRGGSGMTSNKLMQARVLLQAVALALILLAVYFTRK